MCAANTVAVPDPDAACAPCHREIYERYRKTPMGNASGDAVDGFIPGDFRHAASGVHYQVAEQGGRVWMSYDRDDPARPLNGRQELRYFIGSGKRGRTYLFEQEGSWFEAPINWYGKKQLWDMAPNHLADRQMPLTMPVDPGCLRCHASSVASSLPEARNRYSAAPFAQGGISCAGCHGDGRTHVLSQGKAPMMKIDALEPVRRDSVCLSCHLEGQVAIDREGKRIEDFAPGANLFEYSLFFRYRDEAGSGGRATSQWEALLNSECKKASGDRLTCTSCHDPHGSPAPEGRVAIYRQRCLQCHNLPEFASRHHPEDPDCTRCHMAREPSNDIAHEQVTDHFIRKRVSQKPVSRATTGELETIGGFPAGERDLGLAYAEMAERGDHAAAARAINLLRRAERDDRAAMDDGELHAQLGFLEQVAGHSDAAAAEYRHALTASPFNSLALGDLALISAQRKDYREAVRLWKAAFENNPVQVAAGLNLAIVECRTGDRDSALVILDRVLTFSPDDASARAMLAGIRSGTVACPMPSPPAQSYQVH